MSAVQPIYLTRTGERVGQWFGPTPVKPIIIKAKPGYIVGAIHTRNGGVLDAFAVTFVRFDQARIVPSDRYASPWVGGQKGNPGTTGRAGALIVGVTGRISGTGNVCAVGTVSVRARE